MDGYPEIGFFGEFVLKFVYIKKIHYLCAIKWKELINYLTICLQKNEY